MAVLLQRGPVCFATARLLFGPPTACLQSAELLSFLTTIGENVLEESSEIRGSSLGHSDGSAMRLSQSYEFGLTMLPGGTPANLWA